MTNSNEDLVALAERCEAAAGPDRELDFDVLCIADPRAIKTGPIQGDPKYTASLDAAMTLVPEGWARGIHLSPGFKATAELFLPGRVPGVRGAAVTETLALCAAALRARASLPLKP